MSNQQAEIVPDKLWLSHMIVIFRQTEKQTGLSITGFLDMLEDEYDAEPYNDRSIIKSLQTYNKKIHPEEPRKAIV